MLQKIKSVALLSEPPRKLASNNKKVTHYSKLGARGNDFQNLMFSKKIWL